MIRPTVALVVALAALPLVLIAYRVVALGYPLFPPAPEKIWRLSLDARVHAGPGGASVMIALPAQRQGLTVLEETITDQGLSFALRSEGDNRFGLWSGPASPQGVPVSYRAFLIARTAPSVVAASQLPSPYPRDISPAERALAERLMSKVRQLPPQERLKAALAAGSDEWEKELHARSDITAWTAVKKRLGGEKSYLALFRAAELQAQAVEGLALEEGVNDRTAKWIDVRIGGEQRLLELESGRLHDKPPPLLALTTRSVSIVQAMQGSVSDMRWTLARQSMSRWGLHAERIRHSDSLLDRWSLFRLPPENQETFRILLLVPVGALMISILRNVIGFPTFGIFMPVLMALAFRNTGLLYGLAIFTAVLLLGYVVRHAVERFRLLLVPRLSIILTLVIACFTLFALMGNEFGLRELVAVGLLPFVILTMAIERFYVIVEEEGRREGFRTAAGSAAVAAITYAILQLEPLQLTFFVYPELLLIVIAAQVLLGRYTGYRLLEFLRFRGMGRPS